MQIKNLFTDDEAVSPVIGVILMVAITVILAAVIGAFVLGIGSNQEAAPQASLAFDFDKGDDDSWGGGAAVGDANADEINIKHEGGGAINVNQITVKYDGTDVSTGGVNSSSPPTGDTWTAGESWTLQDASNRTLQDASNNFASSKKITVTWTASSGDSSQILKEGTLP